MAELIEEKQVIQIMVVTKYLDPGQPASVMAIVIGERMTLSAPFNMGSL